ncbi:MAG: glycogen/starch synthase [Planctomycetales bacterium]
MKSLVMAAAESAPFSSKSGLGEVVGKLCCEHARTGIETTCIIPFFTGKQGRDSFLAHHQLQAMDLSLEIPLGSKTMTGKVWETTLAESGVRYLLIDQPAFFQRPDLYQEEGQDYRDNCERFTFFSRAVLETIRQLDLNPDIIHAHDWPTGLVPALLDIEYASLPGFSHTRSCFTVHDMSYKGVFWHWDMVLTGLDWKHFNWKQMEFFGNLSLLKTGLVFGDLLTADSPTYAQEIQTAEQGNGLQGVLRSRRQVLRGILNGLDPADWSPETDRTLFQNYGAEDVASGKAANKAAFQHEFGLPVSRDAFLVGVVGPFHRRSGGELLYGLLERSRETDTQFVLLGGSEGECKVTSPIGERTDRAVVVRGELSDVSYRRLLASADAQVLLHRSQPCGFPAMAAGAYGTIPIGQRVGGIADTVCDAVCDGLPPGRIAGFVFHFPDVPNLVTALDRAREQFRSTEHWQRLRQHAMRQRWDWSRTAEIYHEMYQQALGETAPMSAPIVQFSASIQA